VTLSRVALGPSRVRVALGLSLALGVVGCSRLFGSTGSASGAKLDDPALTELACRWDDPSAMPPLAPPQRVESPVPGMMTEQAAQAKRLFDQERWGEAASALAAVAEGHTGDDRGNQELAYYHLGAAYFHLRSYGEALDVFAEIASHPEHLKYREALLWLSKLSVEPGQSRRAIDAVAGYSDDVISAFDNAQQREIYQRLVLVSGRAALRRGDLARAASRFRSVPRESPYKKLADDCLRFSGPKAPVGG
jgi:tetratricopeptide (TPR) repeat protein